MKKKVTATFLGLLTCSFLVGLTELFLYLLYQNSTTFLEPNHNLNIPKISSFHIKPKPADTPLFKGQGIELTKEIVWETIPEQARDDLGRPLFSHREKTFYPEETLLWDQFYTIDEDRFRVTPNEHFKKKASSYLALLGDSHIFGTGVADNQTLAEKLSILYPQKYVKNLAYPTAYPGEILELARSLDRNTLRYESGSSLYFFFEYQLLRNKGGMFNLSSWESIKPAYAIDGDSIIRLGSFEEVYPTRTWLARFLYQSHIFKYLKLELRIEDKDLDFALEMIKQTKFSMASKGSKDFVVVFYPYNQTSLTFEMMKRLSDNQIYFIDLTHIDLFKYIEEPFIPWDGHPTEKANELLAQLISQGLEEVQSLSKNTPGVN